MTSFSFKVELLGNFFQLLDDFLGTTIPARGAGSLSVVDADVYLSDIGLLSLDHSLFSLPTKRSFLQ